MYGAETWAMETEEKMIGVAQMRILRWICGVTRRDKIRNERHHTDVSFHETIYSSMLILKRLDSKIDEKLRDEDLEKEILVRQTFNWAPQGTRRAQRTCPTWLRTMKREVGDNGWKIIDLKTEDRDDWKNLNKGHRQ
ncbi:uncharacterized protein [Palaemon carinicauda]|uniref:uncharacterized protein n=1 Tax=Palaemon carinicauda TaxID=392227 RepID=UPI0035B579D3